MKPQLILSRVSILRNLAQAKRVNHIHFVFNLLEFHHRSHFLSVLLSHSKSEKLEGESYNVLPVPQSCSLYLHVKYMIAHYLNETTKTVKAALNSIFNF